MSLGCTAEPTNGKRVETKSFRPFFVTYRTSHAVSGRFGRFTVV
jgi:hypothetical protein